MLGVWGLGFIRTRVPIMIYALKQADSFRVQVGFMSIYEFGGGGGLGGVTPCAGSQCRQGQGSTEWHHPFRSSQLREDIGSLHAYYRSRTWIRTNAENAGGAKS